MSEMHNDCKECFHYNPGDGCELPYCIDEAREAYTELKPSHYNAGKFDVIAFCLENEIDFCRGNVIKYVVRAGKKDIHKEIEDLNKAKEYIDRIIKHIENKGE